MHKAACKFARGTKNASASGNLRKKRALKRLDPTFVRYQIVPILGEFVHEIFADLT